MSSSPVVFFSYAHQDREVVQRFAAASRAAGLDVSIDVEFLAPGENWVVALQDRLTSADALVAFISPNSRTSSWVSLEIMSFVQESGKFIVPVLIGGAGVEDLPPLLRAYQAVVIREEADIVTAALRVAEAIRGRVGHLELSDEAIVRAGQVAGGIAADLRAPVADMAEAQGRVFLVHGHDHDLRDQVSAFLRSLGIEPVILAQVGDGPRTIVEKFEASATKAAFAVVVMSADDMGASRRQYEDGADGRRHALKYRARENVILELGYFYGRLGWENVFIVQGPSPAAWPDFERPSDLAGVEFFVIGGERDWKAGLSSRLTEAGLLTPP